jgi:prepilin signal peptidase PulO-like enzyme (type II secretory pathway)
MKAVGLTVGALLFATGVALAFAGNRLRGRIVALTAMAAGALVVLISADPTHPATWWLAVTGAVTLAGLIAFARALGRWTERLTGDPAVLDEEPP